MSRRLTDVERLERRTGTRRLLRKEQLILAVTTTFCTEMQVRGVTNSELARRLGRPRSYVTRLLAGSQNLTLGSMAAVADALNGELMVLFRAAAVRARRITR